MKTTAEDDLDRVCAALHPDPHSVLGPHAVGSDTVVRVFRPDAVACFVVVLDAAGGERRRVAMTRVRGAGLFEASLAGALARYRLEVAYASGSFALRDPYAFPPVLGELDLHLAAEGKHRELWKQLGAHVRELEGVRGTSFAVWAPNARRVSVTGDFNAWDGRLHAMRRLGNGTWEIFVPDVGEGALYKFELITEGGLPVLKADPYAQQMEVRPGNASVVTTSRFTWSDAPWLARRAEARAHEMPVSIYEVHLGSWKRRKKTGAPGEPDLPTQDETRWLTYRELAHELVDYVADLGFTHIELMPVTEHPFDGSWGYQTSGYFAPTSRYGTPDDFRYFVDRCHARGLGVLLDWTPAHFPKDAWCLGRFDGTALFEHPDSRRGEHGHWGTFIFNYARLEVRNFLLASALYWLDEFHVDGLRVDAVASMLYLDYSANGPDDWLPNEHGGRENLEAVSLLRELNDLVHARFPGAIVAAEESTTWPGVTKPTYVGGLGFDFKWNMGWMHDTLDYFSLDPVFRAFNHRLINFGIMYAFSERFLLPFSHDEVVHLKKSLVSKMPGDRWLMHAGLRSELSYMWAHPGKKLLFMGAEIGQYHEWHETRELDWWLLGERDHAGLHRLVRDLNAMLRELGALHEVDHDERGFSWIDANDAQQSVASFIRYPKPTKVASGVAVKRGLFVVYVGNFTPVVRRGYRIGVPRGGAYLERMNTDAADYGGSGVGNLGRVMAEAKPSHGHPFSLVLTLPPLAGLYLVPENADDPEPPPDERREKEPSIEPQSEGRGRAANPANRK